MKPTSWLVMLRKRTSHIYAVIRSKISKSLYRENCLQVIILIKKGIFGGKLEMSCQSLINVVLLHANFWPFNVVMWPNFTTKVCDCKKKALIIRILASKNKQIVSATLPRVLLCKPYSVELTRVTTTELECMGIWP